MEQVSETSCKTCADCGMSKPFNDFHRSKKGRFGLHPYCKVCSSARQRAAYAARGKRSWTTDSRCTRCGELKPKTAFAVRNGRVSRACMACEEIEAARHAAGLKQCNICKKWLPTSSFHPSKLKIARTACAECTSAQMKTYRPRIRAYQLMKEYGITVEQYLQLIEKQNGRCPVCKIPFEPGNLSYPVDHVHAGKHKGRIRAIVHDVCNRHVLWGHEDSAQLRAAADLIDNPLTDWYVPGVPSSELRWAKQPKKGGK